MTDNGESRPVSQPAVLSVPVRTGTLTGRRVHEFAITPDAAARTALAADLGLIGLSRLRFVGRLRPEGRTDLVLEADLDADVVQPCVVTLAPVASKLREKVLRRYVAGLAPPEDAETEMPEDDTEEPLPEVIDLGEVLAEALALVLPPWPRAPGVELGEAVFAAPGVAPLRDGDLNPFAALAALKAGGKGEKPKPE